MVEKPLVCTANISGQSEIILHHILVRFQQTSKYYLAEKCPENVKKEHLCMPLFFGHT